MGTDITVAAERRRKMGGWERAQPVVPIAEAYPGHYRYDDTRRVYSPVYGGRNYALFDVLAFGVAVGERLLVEPAARERGLPHDAAEETRAEFESDTSTGNISYATSWLTVAEIEAFDWDQRVPSVSTRRVGFDPEADRRGPIPPLMRWWVKATPPVEAPPDGVGWEPIGARFTGRDGGIFQTFVRPSSRTYREACSDFLTTALPKLRALGPPDDVRIVFWFM